MTTQYNSDSITITHEDIGTLDEAIQKSIKVAEELLIPYPIIIGMFQTHLQNLTAAFIRNTNAHMQAFANVEVANGQPI